MTILTVLKYTPILVLDPLYHQSLPNPILKEWYLKIMYNICHDMESINEPMTKDFCMTFDAYINKEIDEEICEDAFHQITKNVLRNKHSVIHDVKIAESILFAGQMISDLLIPAEFIDDSIQSLSCLYDAFNEVPITYEQILEILENYKKFLSDILIAAE